MKAFAQIFCTCLKWQKKYANIAAFPAYELITSRSTIKPIREESPSIAHSATNPAKQLVTSIKTLEHIQERSLWINCTQCNYSCCCPQDTHSDIFRRETFRVWPVRQFLHKSWYPEEAQARAYWRKPFVCKQCNYSEVWHAFKYRGKTFYLQEMQLFS